MKKIRSYTNIWNVEKVLYSINDLKLPFPVTYTQMAWMVASVIFVIMFGNIPPFCFIENVFIKYLVVPVGVTWFMSKKTFDGKKPYAFLKSVFSYFTRAKRTYAGKKVQYRKKKIDEFITIVRCESYVPDKVH